jgi:hypothetical protein
MKSDPKNLQALITSSTTTTTTTTTITKIILTPSQIRLQYGMVDVSRKFDSITLYN